ncbi:tubulin-specific chaperone A-like [Rhopilema esculentum]|uniref:tubulin-specific chaperone A-like n=1 Tax=Rhopilema esculentum TaxID=499914 RepID=UPI0031E01197
MATQDPRIRQIKIKTGVVKRLGKEKGLYGKEVKEQEEKIEKMKAEQKDEYDIKKQIEVLNESRRMIPDCTKRLRTAHNELSQLLEKEQDLAETEEFIAAKEVLQVTTVE